jgi:hypothetical protein
MAKIYISAINIHVRRVCNAHVLVLYLSLSLSFPVLLSSFHPPACLLLSTSSDLPWSSSCRFHVLRSVLFWSYSSSFYPFPSVLFWSSSCSLYPFPSVLFWSSSCSLYPVPSVLFWSSSCSFQPIPSVLLWSRHVHFMSSALSSSGPPCPFNVLRSVLVCSYSCSSFYPFHLSSSCHSRPQSSSHPCHVFLFTIPSPSCPPSVLFMPPPLHFPLLSSSRPPLILFIPSSCLTVLLSYLYCYIKKPSYSHHPNFFLVFKSSSWLFHVLLMSLSFFSFCSIVLFLSYSRLHVPVLSPCLFSWIFLSHPSSFCPPYALMSSSCPSHALMSSSYLARPLLVFLMPSCPLLV